MEVRMKPQSKTDVSVIDAVANELGIDRGARDLTAMVRKARKARARLQKLRSAIDAADAALAELAA